MRSYDSSVFMKSSKPINVITTLILSSCHILGHTSGRFPRGFPTNILNKVKFFEHAVKTYGSKGTAVLILNLGARWCMVSSTNRPLYHWGDSPWCSVNRRRRGASEPIWVLWRREVCRRCRELNDDSLVFQPVAQSLHKILFAFVSPILATCPTRYSSRGLCDHLTI